MRILVTVFCVLAATALPAQQPRVAADAPAVNAVPVENEPHHRPVYENQWVRVLDVRVLGGDSTLYHIHRHPMIGVVIMTARQWGQSPGTNPSSLTLAVGQVINNFANTLPYTHRVVNADTVPFRYIAVELLHSFGISAPPLPNSSTTQLVEDRPLARAYRIVLAPGQSVDLQGHKQPGLLVQVSAGNVQLEGAQPSAESANGESRAGAWWWRAPGAPNSVRNFGREPVELVQIDVE